MKCPRCGGRIEDDKLFCERCGEEIRIVKDFEPDIEGLTDGIGQEISSIEESSQLNIDADEADGRSKQEFQGRLFAAGLLLFVLAVAGIFFFLARFQNAEYQNERARAYLQEKKYERAAPYARRAVTLSPENAAYLTDYVICLAAQEGNEKEIEQLCLRILELDPVMGAAYKQLISIYEKEGDYQKINELLLECPDETIVNQYPAYVAKPPEFSYPSDVYDELLSLKLIANTSGTIYYTTDGSEPDENSLVYTAPLLLEAGNYRIRALFVNDYGVSSEVSEGNYYVDVTVPDAPVITPESGEYSRPTLISVEMGENCSVYYTTDGSVPNQDSTQYSAPFPMPIGVTRFRFISYSAAGAAGEETQVTYSLKLHATLGIDAARNKLLIELKDAGVIKDLDGSVETGAGHNVYNYRCAVTIQGIDFYLYREYYEDGAGNRTGTGSDYVVSILEGQCYKAVQAEASEQTASPWSSLSLQNINSGASPE